jgi:hypothetical protein
MALDWKYCECGCHGHEAEAGHLAFWLYNDLQGGYHLHRDSRYGLKIGRFDSFDAADAAAMVFVKAEAEKSAAAFRKALEP